MSGPVEQNPFAITEANSTFIKAALALAQKGMFVFPCKFDKSPYTSNGLHDATRDPEVIRAWGSRRLDAAIGINCTKSGIVVVDEDAEGAMSRWRSDRSLTLPKAVTAETPSGGRHLYFSAVDGVSYPIRLCDGVDIKHDGYVIAPPSTCFSKRADVEGKYRWLPGYGDFAEAPRWLEKPSKPQIETPAAGPVDQFLIGELRELVDAIDPDIEYGD